MMANETPILESVFVDCAPNAACIADVISEGMPLAEIYWYFVPLSYAELAAWASEACACSRGPHHDGDCSDYCACGVHRDAHRGPDGWVSCSEVRSI